MDYIEFKAKILPLEVGRDILIAELSEIGFESFVETDNGLEAYISVKDYNKEEILTLKILSNSNFKISYLIKIIKEKNWNAEWEKSFNPINVNNRCQISAPFHNKIDNIEYDIVIDPKMSFGTGHHETTFLMIACLLGLDLKNKKVLDMGCGTGVLAILAELKEAKYIEAIDIDEWAYNNTLENIRNNNCNNITVQLGGAELISSLGFDVIMANINRNILLNDMSKYAKSLSNKGVLMLSGFFSLDKELLLSEATKLGLSLIASKSKNDWTMLQMVKE